jgi:hypothetical protein
VAQKFFAPYSFFAKKIATFWKIFSPDCSKIFRPVFFSLACLSSEKKQHLPTFALEKKGVFLCFFKRKRILTKKNITFRKILPPNGSKIFRTVRLGTEKIFRHNKIFWAPNGKTLRTVAILVAKTLFRLKERKASSCVFFQTKWILATKNATFEKFSHWVAQNFSAPYSFHSFYFVRKARNAFPFYLSPCLYSSLEPRIKARLLCNLVM